ncbi:unnamed protein product [Merluccius merluccius]
MCCTFFLKTMMFIFNGCIFLAGVAVLGVGIWLKVDEDALNDLLGSIEDVPGGLAGLAQVSYLLIGVGAVLLVIGFLGCCGAVRESRCMLMTFFVILLIIFIAEVAAAVLVFVFEKEAAAILRSLENEVIDQLKQSYAENNTLPALWDTMMQGFECCGFSNYTNFGNVAVYPAPCCNASLVAVEGCTAALAEKSDIEGCYDYIVQFIKDNVVIIGAVAVGIAAIEVWKTLMWSLKAAVAWAPSASPFAHNAVESPLTEPAVGGELESSGGGPNEPPTLLLRHGVGKAVGPVGVRPGLPARPGLFQQGPAAPRGGPRMPFPAFLSRGRAGPAGGAVGGPLHHPRVKESPGGLDMRKRMGLHMWQQAVSKEEHPKVSLALSLKDVRRQICTAIPFTQRVSVEGCEAVTVHNKLCFGQCSSLFVPSGGVEEEAAAGGRARRGACSRCSPSRTHAERVPLRCGSKGFLEKQVMVVDECRCETSREEVGDGEVPAATHL